MFSLHEFFTDPILRAPTLGAMLMSLCCALVGVVAFVQRKSLIGETVSHAAFPGVALGGVVGAALGGLPEEGLGWWGLLGGGISAFLGMVAVEKMERRGVRSDSALCFVLALFLGAGVLIASRMQLTHAMWFRGVRAFFYGQVATIRGSDLPVYIAFTSVVIAMIIAFFPRMKVVFFDRGFAKSAGLEGRWFRFAMQTLFVFAVVIGMRSIGIVLMAGMFVAPAVAARALSGKFSVVFWLAGIFGVISAFFGQFLSVQLPRVFDLQVSLATGPMIVLVAIVIAFLALLFAPERGLVARSLRARKFHKRCARENLLKSYWKQWQDGVIPERYFREVKQLMRLGYATKDESGFRLTVQGRKEAARLVRVHRLWEVYLDDLGLHGEAVHDNASEMEHIISDEFEESLSAMLGDPKKDPHNQPIPQKGEF